MSEKHELDYEQDLEIDESALDVEWLDQPRKFMRYARLYAAARQEHDFCKERLEMLKARLDRQIRSDPEMYGLAKVTENSVLNAVLIDEEYGNANQEVITKRYEMELLSKAVQAFDQRKVALENLVKLHGQSYFAGPKVPRDLIQERKQEVKIKPVRRRVKRS